MNLKTNTIRRIATQTTAGAAMMTRRAAMLLTALFTMAATVTATVVTTTSDWSDLQAKLNQTDENAPDVIQLATDISNSGTNNLTVPDGRSVTLDLNGHTLNLTNKTLVISGNLTVKDTNPSASNNITGSGSFVMQIGSGTNTGTMALVSGKISGNTYGIQVNKGSLTMDGGEVSAGNDAIYINTNGSFVMNDGLVSAGGTPSVILNKNSFVMNGGRVVATEDGIGLELFANSSAEINGGTIEALCEDNSGGVGITAFKNTELTIHNGTITAYRWALTSSGSTTGSNDGSNSNFTIDGGSLTSTHDVAIYAPQPSGVVTIAGGTITGAKSGIEFRARTLNIQGGTITGNTQNYDTSDTGYGIIGSAVAVVQHTTKQDIDVNISGGTLIGYLPLSEHNTCNNSEEELRKINYAISGGLFHSTGTKTINIEDYLNGPFIAGGRFTHSVAQYVAGGCSEYHDSDTDPYYVSLNYLADGMKYLMSSDVDVNTIIYKKTLGAERIGKHQAWLVPFDYTITTDDVEKFTFYKINMIANSPSPTQEATDEMWVFLTKLNAGAVLHANMPYVYKPKTEVTDYPFTSSNATLKAKNTGVIAKTETLEDIYSFYGTFENTTATTSDPFYYVGIDGNVSYGDAVTVGPYRWIIRKTSKFGNTPSYVRKMHFFDDETTGIEEIVNRKSSNSESHDAVYTLDGRCLAGKPTKSGMYVVGGKKVIIK